MVYVCHNLNSFCFKKQWFVHIKYIVKVKFYLHLGYLGQDNFIIIIYLVVSTAAPLKELIMYKKNQIIKILYVDFFKNATKVLKYQQSESAV